MQGKQSCGEQTSEDRRKSWRSAGEMVEQLRGYGHKEDEIQPVENDVGEVESPWIQPPKQIVQAVSQPGNGLVWAIPRRRKSPANLLGTQSSKVEVLRQER